MRSTALFVGCALLGTAYLPAADAPRYVISTYAGGVPALPNAAIALASDTNGNVYFVDGIGVDRAPALSNSVFRIDARGSVTRVAGNSRTGFSGDGGPATSAALLGPRGVAFDRDGNLLIADTGNHRIRRVSPDGTITTLAGGGSTGLGDDGPAKSAQLSYPSSIAVDAEGNLFIGEIGRVRKVAPDGIITTVAGGGSDDPNDGASATKVRLTNANAVAVDSAGNLFIADQILDSDYYTYVIRRVSPDGTITTLPSVPNCCVASIAVDNSGNVLAPAGTNIYRISPSGGQTVIAGTGVYGQPAGDGGPATKAQLNAPSAVSVDGAGNLLIADNLGRGIRIVTPDGIILTLASIPAAAPLPAGDGGRATLTALQLAVPGLSDQSGLAEDAAGNLYMAETGANRVRKVSPDGTITTVAGVGGPRCPAPAVCLPLGDGGPAVKAALFYPTSVAVDSTGNLFIADYGNLRVRKVSPDGIITTYAGNGGWPGWPPVGGDGGPAVGIPIVAQNVAVDGAGNLLISEATYGSIRKVSPDGIVRTVFAPGTSSVFFDLISAIAADGAGNLFVAGSACDNDSCYHRIRKISPSGEATTIAGGRDALSLQPDAAIGDGGPAIDAPIGFISSIAVDAAGNVFLTDLIGQRVRKIDANGIISTVGGNGLSGYSGDGGPGADASIYYPLGLATDARGNVYVSDFNQSVRVLRVSGQE